LRFGKVYGPLSGCRNSIVGRFLSDTGKAVELLGWTPEINLDKGLKRRVNWFLKRLATRP
jgi:nucleoside-diphosphate-sugar epimerase